MGDFNFYLHVFDKIDFHLGLKVCLFFTSYQTIFLNLYLCSHLLLKEYNFYCKQNFTNIIYLYIFISVHLWIFVAFLTVFGFIGAFGCLGFLWIKGFFFENFILCSYLDLWFVFNLTTFSPRLRPLTWITLFFNILIFFM